MAGSTYSSNLKIELMSTGENAGTWGNITNTNLGTALEQAVVGLGNPDFVADANLTITITNSNAAQAARALVLNVTSAFGSLTATRELVVPTSQKQYIVQNNTAGGQSITVKTSGGTGITVPNGRKAHLYVDGTNVVQMFDFVDINGGAIDGTTVGAAAASTGAFTNLSASGTLGVTGVATLGVGAVLNTPASVTLTNATGLPISTGVSGLGTGVATFLGTPSSANLRTAVTDETGTGSLVFANSPTLVTPALGTPASGVVTNLTGTASININGTVGATTPNTGSFTVLTENAFPVVTQTDVGTAPNQLPLNQYLGDLAYQDAANIAGNVGVGNNLSYTGTLTGGTGVINIGSGQLYKDASGNVGIGGTTTTGWADKQVVLDAGAGVSASYVLVNNTTGRTGTDGSIITLSGSDMFLINRESANMIFRTANTERMRIDSAGNVGIGTSSPANLIHGRKDQSAAATYGIVQNDGAASSTTYAGWVIQDGSTVVSGIRRQRDGGASATQVGAFAGTSPLALWAGDAERARIDSSGNLLVARTSDTDLAVGTTISNAGWIRCTQEATKSVFTKLNNTGDIIEFRYATGAAAAVGSISTNGTTTSYNITSDYRLKHDIQPMTGALAKVAQLKPVTYKWNADDSESQGFIAHELQEVVPECVTGEKDAVDADGNPQYQGIDTSFLVATLTAAIQEQQAIITALTARVEALEGTQP